MEIFTYVLAGALEHRDSMGNGSIIRPGDVQMMSAGSGIRHSEFNPSPTEVVHLLQIWIVPDRLHVEPRYQQAYFADEEKRGHLRLIISPDAANGSLSVYQDVRVYAGLFDGDERATLSLPPDWQPQGLITVGYPAETKTKTRAPLETRVWRVTE